MSAAAESTLARSAAPERAAVLAGAGAPSAAAADWSRSTRLAALRRFAFAITALNVVGHTWLGFETAWAHPLVAAATAYTLELIFETLDARAQRRVARYREGGLVGFVDFLLSAHISAMAVSMLLYPGERLLPIVFATTVAVGSKAILRVEMQGRSRHLMNPSNLGIAATLILFPWVGIAPPYQFTEALLGVGNWIFPAVLICLGSFLNGRFTHRLPLIAAWGIGFAAQALLRHFLFGTALAAALFPMTGLAFLLFTFYMITDPPTTPSSTRGQIVFGASTAAVYGVLMSLHIVFGLFFSLVIVCGVRGCLLGVASVRRDAATDPSRLPVAGSQGTPASS